MAFWDNHCFCKARGALRTSKEEWERFPGSSLGFEIQEEFRPTGASPFFPPVPSLGPQITLFWGPGSETQNLVNTAVLAKRTASRAPP